MPPARPDLPQPLGPSHPGLPSETRDEAGPRTAPVSADADADRHGSPDRPCEDAEQERESLGKAVTHTLEEARMVLPGVQALFGFQLVAVLNPPFYGLLSFTQQRLHLVGVLLTALSIALMMTPAAYHRQAEQHSVSQRFLALASRLITLGMFTLMLALTLDCYLVAGIILRSALGALFIALGLALIFVSLWFVMPRLVRPRSAREPSHDRDRHTRPRRPARAPLSD